MATVGVVNTVAPLAASALFAQHFALESTFQVRLTNDDGSVRDFTGYGAPQVEAEAYYTPLPNEPVAPLTLDSLEPIEPEKSQAGLAGIRASYENPATGDVLIHVPGAAHVHGNPAPNESERVPVLLVYCLLYTSPSPRDS